MKLRVPDYFKDFKCIASQCEDTCCAGWEVVIDNDTYKKYQMVEGDFGDRLRSEIAHENGENIFVLKGNDCPFLNESKMCDIYTEIGEEYLCYTCKQYPRYMEEFGSLREVGISLSCPEAARIILNNDSKLNFEISDIDEEIIRYNEIDGMLFINLLQCRKVLFDILQNREIDLEYRVSLALMFSEEIQEKIDEDTIDEIKNVKEKYLDSKYISSIMKKISNYKGNESIKHANIYEFFNIFKELKHIHPNDPLGLDDALRLFWQGDDSSELYISKHREFSKYYSTEMYKFEKLMVYFIYRYFMKSVFDYDVASKVKTAAVSYLMVKELFLSRWIENKEITEKDAIDIIHMYSKDIEHLEENIETLSKVFEVNDIFNIEGLLNVLMN